MTILIKTHQIPKKFTIKQRETIERALDHHEILLSDDVVVSPHYQFGDDGFTHMHIKDMVPLMHTGPRGCGKIALFYTHFPDAKENIQAYNAKLLNNHNPHPQQPFACDTCKLEITDPREIAAVCPTCHSNPHDDPNFTTHCYKCGTQLRQR